MKNNKKSPKKYWKILKNHNTTYEKEEIKNKRMNEKYHKKTWKTTKKLQKLDEKSPWKKRNI